MGTLLDSDNPVVQLCVAGIEAEMAGQMDEAGRLYRHAWDARRDDLDACIAAHYVARRQDCLDEALRWNQEALDRAKCVDDARVSGFFPSLYLNLGRSHESLGNLGQAAVCYREAASWQSELDADSYGNLVRRGIEDGLARVGVERSG